MDNPFEIIEQRLKSIENFLQQIHTGSLQAAPTQVAEAYLKIDQAAAFLSTTPNALRVMVCKSQIAYIKKHGRLFFRQSDLIKWLEAGGIDS